MTVEIIYETHATSSDNERGVATGWLPGQLSETGRTQARALGERRRSDNIAAVFVSDLRRAVETAELAFASTSIPIYQDARLRECNYGTLNGMPVARVAAERVQHIDQPFLDGQSYNQVVAETHDLLCELASNWSGSRIVIIAHSANKWALDHLLKGKPLEDLVDAPFNWQEGWQYVLPTGWPGLTS
jgi:broad specificity phosphatase PhoE